MKRYGIMWAVTMVLGLAMLLTACGQGAQPLSGESRPPVPQSEPAAPDTSGGSRTSAPTANQEPAPTQELPQIAGDMAALKAALGESTPIRYRIAAATAPRGADKTAYLEEMLGEKGYPGKNEVLLLVFPQDHYDIRFAMGALLFEKKLSVQSMLDLVRSHYFPKARAGDPAGGLADLIRAVNSQVK